MGPPDSRIATTEPLSWKVGLLALAISLLWSGNIVSLKVGLETIPPFWIAFWRMLVAVLGVAAWGWATGNPVLMERRRLGQMAVLSGLFTVQIAVFNLSVDFTSPSYAVIMLNTTPVLVNFISHFFVQDDRLTVARLAGLAIGFAGISYLMLGRPSPELAPNPLLGNILMLVSALLLAVRIVYTQILVQEMDPLRPVIWQMALSLPCFLALALGLEAPLLKPLGLEAVLAVLYQSVIVAGFCFVAWTMLLRRYSAGNLSVYSFSVPFFGILLSWLVFGEPVTGRLLSGAIAVSAGIWIVVRSKQREAGGAE